MSHIKNKKNKKNNKNDKNYKNYIMIPNEMTHYSMISGKNPWRLKPTYIADKYGD